MPTLDEMLSGVMERMAELERRVANQVRHGRITHVDAAKQLMRVRLNPEAESEPFLSAWIPYGQQAGAFKFHNPPSVGQNATLISPGGDPAQSVGLPFTWSDQNKSPGDSEDEHVITFGDLKISYKKDKYTISVGSASITIEKDKSIKMTAAELIENKVGSSITELKPARINVEATETIIAKKTWIGQDQKDKKEGPLVTTEGGPAEKAWAKIGG